MKIEELYMRECNGTCGKIAITAHSGRCIGKHMDSSSRRRQIDNNLGKKSLHNGSKLVRCRSATNMRLEQLSKHEEISYMEDAEANEAILKNTVSKEELCRYLSPLKFLEIETWRKEVPYGDKVETSETEHRKWRTPIQILLPTAGFEDDDFLDSTDGAIGLKEKGRKKPAMNTNKRTFEDVQRQNAQVLRRTNSDATQTRYEVIRPRIREITSAGDRVYSRNKQGLSATQPKKSSEERLKGSYTPANEVKTKQDNDSNNAKHSGHIYVNQRLSGSLLTRDAVLTSYFAPGRPVTSSKMRSQRIDSRNTTWATRPSTQPAPNSVSPNRNGITLATLPITASKSPKKVSVSSSPRFSGDESLKKVEKKTDKEDVRVLTLSSGRPNTAYDDIKSHTFENPHSRHPAFRGSNKSLNRGWRSWNKRSFENRMNCVTQIYQSPVINKKAVGSGISNKTTRARLSSLEKTPKLADKTSSGIRSGKSARSHGINNEESDNRVGKKEKSITVQQEYLTRISYSLTNGNRITTSRISDEHESTECLPETIIPSPEKQMENTQTNLSQEADSTNEAENDMKARDPNSSKDQNKTAASPWVDEAFNSVWAESEGYYVRKPKLNKTVTFSLNQPTNDDRVTSHGVTKSRDAKSSSMTQSRRKIELLPYNHVSLSNGKAKMPLDSLRNGNIKSLENRKNLYARINSQDPWAGNSVGRLGFGNGIRFPTGTVNSVTT